MKFGTPAQQERLLPKMATGEIRAAFSMSEPELGSDVAAIKTSGVKDGDDYVINGSKMWVTNGLMSGVVFVLVRTDREASPPHRGLTCFVAEKEPGASGEPGADRPAEDQEARLQGRRVDRAGLRRLSLPGGHDPRRRGSGPEQGLRADDGRAWRSGRVNVAARGVGIAQRALELGLKYAQERRTFGKPIAEHQAIQFKLADMATKVEAARLLMLKAATLKDAGERSDVEAGMAKLFASETGKEVVEDSFRIHGGYGYSKEYEIERLYRDAPLLLIGEGTSEIQRMVIGRKLIARNKI